ncbi:hypothetical protein J2777_005959 [Paraburkholderia graminis]|nr:hypothetical protein [Paraburkholderia graminis]
MHVVPAAEAKNRAFNFGYRFICCTAQLQVLKAYPSRGTPSRAIPRYESRTAVAYVSNGPSYTPNRTLPNNTHNSRLSSKPHNVRQHRRNKKSPA